MTKRSSLFGVVLAGGRSSRFGGEKALAQLGGRSLLARAAESLRPHAMEIAVSAAAGSATEALAQTMDLAVVHDEARGAVGPLHGVLAGLVWALSRGGEWLITLPCDVVLVPRDALAALVSASEEKHAAYIVSRRGMESLCAIWPVAATSRLEAALKDGKHPPVRDILYALDAIEVPVADNDAFLNVNTREDLAAAEKALKSPE